MKIFIWENIDKLTKNWHSEGGLIVIAESLKTAIKLAKAKEVQFQENELKPTETYIIQAEKEKVYIFANAGCC